MAKNRVLPERRLYAQHGGHEHHLCDLVARRQMDKVADFSKDAKYICFICGRAAADASNLCEPVLI